jgi:HEAT repeat protein
LASLVDLQSAGAVSASPARLSDHQIEELERLDPQQQAEVLVQRAVNQYQGALEQIAQRVEGWRGQLNLTPGFNAMLRLALNSNDLRVRAAALEIFLTAYNLPKSDDSHFQLARRVADDPGSRPWALWMLGALGNRGVQASQAFYLLERHAKDPVEETRHWAVEGMALLGTDATIPQLLDIFRNDPSLRIRERAACSLAQSGMLQKAQRMKAVPALLDMAGDPALDSTTRSWVFQALRDITGESHGADLDAWRAWWHSRS